jgi:hypothetical protein
VIIEAPPLIDEMSVAPPGFHTHQLLMAPTDPDNTGADGGSRGWVVITTSSDLMPVGTRPPGAIYCFEDAEHPENFSYCGTWLVSCNEVRKSTLSTHPDWKLSDCIPTPEAFCFSYELATKTRFAVGCTKTLSSCQHRIRQFTPQLVHRSARILSPCARAQ